MRGRYGAGPRHLLAALVTFAFAGYAAVRIVQSTSSAAFTVGVWFVLAIVANDLAFVPLMTVLRRLAGRVLGARAAVVLAVPATLAVLLLLAWLPLVLGKGLYRFVTTLSIAPFATRWALIAAGLLLVSAVVARVRR
jgi:hypothetical protein